MRFGLDSVISEPVKRIQCPPPRPLSSTLSRRAVLRAGLTIATTLARRSAADGETKDTMLPLKQTDIATNGISLRVTEIGEGPTILFVHGFPDTA